jgi:hypothetical protein
MKIISARGLGLVFLLFITSKSFLFHAYCPYTARSGCLLVSSCMSRLTLLYYDVLCCTMLCYAYVVLCWFSVLCRRSRLARKGMRNAPDPIPERKGNGNGRSPPPSNRGTSRRPSSAAAAAAALSGRAQEAGVDAHCLSEVQEFQNEEEGGEEGEEDFFGYSPADNNSENSDNSLLDELEINMEGLDLDLEQEQDGSGGGAGERPQSPRHRFLLRLISEGKVPPLPIIIRHHKVKQELNLAHRALGDDYIIYLSDVVEDLPSLTKLNLRDNRLTDRGMGVFIHALAGQQRILDIDISENKIDSASADALTHYLKDPHCKLAKLRMANADLDDDEIAIFMNALETNESIVEMDVSHNLLGGGEKQTKNMNINSENLTGGASVAAALKHNKTLLNLDLSWNKLGLASSTHLGYALAINNSLLSINLAYNTIRDDGAEIIGSSLASNSALRVLNLSSNGIGPQGMVVLSTGLRLCRGLERLDISGNPIGRQGVSSLLQTLNYHSVHRTFNLSDCVFDDSGQKTVVDLEFPTGKFNLDLSKPSTRCIVLELYLLASTTRGLTFKSIDYRGPGKNSKKVHVKLVRPENPCYHMGAPYSPFRGSECSGRHPYTLMEAAEWMAIVDKLYLIDESTGNKWDVPFEGAVVMDCVYSPQLATPIECLNATGLRRLVELIQDHPKQYLQILGQCQNVVMESYQLDELLTSLSSGGLLKQRTEVVANLLACCCDASNVGEILDNHLPKMESAKDVQLLMRNMFYLCTNSYTGHYSLDLENSIDRRTALRLMAISAHENGYIKHSMPSWGPTHLYTSQNGTKTNFRNETYRNLPIENGLTAAFFSLGLKDKIHGVLDFDFVSITRPEEGCVAVGNCNLEKALEARGLLYPLTALSSSVLRARRRALQVSADSPGGTQKSAILHNSQSISSVLSDAQSVITMGVEPVPDLEEVLGPQVQSEVARITTRGPLPCPVVDFHQFAEKSPLKCLENMKMEDLTLLNTQLNLDNAMFFDGKQMEKYVINIAIRVQSLNSQNFLEPTALLQRLAENGKFGFSGQGKNDDSKLSINDILSVDSYIDTVKFDIGLLMNPNAKNMKPTHKKYLLRDDIIAVGSEIYVEVKCPLWSMEKIVQRAKEVVATFFNCLGVTETHVKLMNHKISETKTSNFPASTTGSFSNCTTRVIVHQVDVSVDGLPEVDEVLMKTSSKANVAYNNIVWRWRPRTMRDRGSAKVDLSLSCHEYWGVKVMHLRTLLGGLWITCAQAAFIASRFPQFGSEGHPLRETVIVVLFSRVVDLENFRIVVETLPPNNFRGVYSRVGWMNAINPHEVDYLFNLDLSKGDERLLAATLSKFAAVEPGDNVLEPRHRRTYEDIFIYGWDLPASWCVDPEKAKFNDGVPRKGQMIGEYCSSPLKGCKKVPWVREEYHDRYFLMAVPRAAWDDDYYQHAPEDKMWAI